MSIGLIGTKLGMTREFMETGQSVPVTVIKIEKGRVLDVITKEKRGYKLNFFRKFSTFCNLNGNAQIQRKSMKICAD